MMEEIIMQRKRLKEFSLYAVAALATVSLIVLGIVFSTKKNTTAQVAKIAEEVQLTKPKARVAVHDPSIVKVEDTYYVFGSHIDAAKSTDLMNWTKFTNSYARTGNKLYGDLSKNLAGSFDWAGENDSDSKGGFSVWAPDVFWNADYVNSDGTKGAYVIYYSASSTYIRSAIGYAASQNIEGPYTYVDTVIYSGITKEEAYDKNSKVNKKYTNTNIQKLIDNGTLEGPRPGWFNGNGSYNNGSFPNAIDANLFYDKEGKLWMIYGSWSGGIFALEIDKTTGKPIYPGKDGTTSDGRMVDRYYGTKIAGGHGKSGEGPYVVYDKESGYYYLYVTYGGLAAKGGYNTRLFRATNPAGPYKDAAGKPAVLPNSTDNANYGVKIMGNYKFDSLNVGYRSPGHNSSFIDSDGQMYLIYHTRFDNGTEGHQVRVHQMFINEDGWPVTAPYEYNGDKISPTGYSTDEVVGSYEFINHGTSNNAVMLKTLKVKLNKDNTITGDVTGTWKMTEGKYYMSIEIKGVTYKGVFFKQKDESKFDNVQVMTFSAIGTNNQSIWGSREYDNSSAVNFAAFDLETKVAKTAKANIKLPTEGNYGTTITWTSSNKDVIDNTGAVTPTREAAEVTLTATITKGDAAVSKEFKVQVSGK
jgi:arabinan endo-1,5-alpha-L-arabinosidase